jgi:tetratricopeptide (TPR) repeat protein
MFKTVLVFFISIILTINLNIENLTSSVNGGRLVCISEITKYFSFGNKSQISDALWLRFVQEIDAYNEGKIATPHLCPDNTTSWHFHILNLAMELDEKFYEMAAIGPLTVSITINDSVGASKLFNKAVENFPNDWKILYQAAYHAQIEEKKLEKAADLFNRAGKNGAPRWVFSLSGGIYNELGMKALANGIYLFLINNFPNDPNTKRLKDKIDKKVKNFYIKKIE